MIGHSVHTHTWDKTGKDVPKIHCELIMTLSDFFFFRIKTSC